MPVTKTCEYCGTPFNVRPAKGYQRFCSFACRKAKRESAHAEKICENCGVTFVVTRKRELSKRFCSKSCTASYETTHGRPAARVPRKTHEHFTCKHCGKPFSKPSSAVAEYRKKHGKDPLYCSNKCSGLGRRADADKRNETTCKNCGKTFRKSRKHSSGGFYREQMLCSRQCKNEWVSKVYREKHGLPTITKRIRRGYVLLRIPASNGQPARHILEHRYVMEQFLGRPLSRNETVHHRLEPKTDNSLKNLELRVGNHGPGHSIDDILDWCVEMMQRYERFLAQKGYRLVSITE